MLITFEGIECSGKGTQAQLLLQALINKQYPAILSREPGGVPYGEALRALLKHPELTLPAIWRELRGHEDFPDLKLLPYEFSRSSECELFMFLAARAEFVNSFVRPKLAQGKIVILDRFLDSTRAYQGGGRFYSHPDKISLISQMNRLASPGLNPDITFLLNISVAEMIQRQQSKRGGDAFFERTCNKSFFERVRQEYLTIAQEAPERVVVIDGAKDINKINAQIVRATEIRLLSRYTED